MRTTRLAFTTAIAFGAMACAAIWGFDDLKPGSNPTDGGGNDNPTAPDVGPACNLDHPEDPAGDPGGTTKFLTAVDSFDIGTYRDASAVPEGGRAVAYDLDNVCTCHAVTGGPSQESCIRPADPSTCDDTRGRDDVGRILLATLQTFVSIDKFTSEGAGDQLRAGQFGIFIMVQGYNDMPDDSDVTVYIVPSFGLGTVSNGTITQHASPTFTSSDQWTFDSRFGQKLGAQQVIGDGTYNKAATKGWVRGGRLYARLDDLYVDFQLNVTNGNPLLLHITDALASAKIVKVGNEYRLDDGRISGRWATGDLLRAIGAWELSSPIPGPICANAPDGSAYPAVKNIVCGKRDISARGNTEPTKPCDALSFGLGFTAKPASVGQPAGYTFQTTSCFDGSAPPLLGNYPDDCTN